jgi:two-component system cell cycle response regulator
MGARILVVEDTAYSLQLMTYLLTAYEHTVVEAVTGEQAIELASATAPDLVVLDLQLPGIDGFETLTALRSIPDRDAVPVIAVTSFAMVGDRDRALAAGFDHYVTKPIEPESFVEEISTRLPEQLRGKGRRPPGPEPASTIELAPRPRPNERPGADIIVLDDSLINQTLLRSILEPRGYRVRTASTLDEAIDAVDAVCPDLVLSDVHIGDHSGAELLSHLRALPVLTVVPFAFLSATTDWQDPILGDGKARFIRRPIEPSALLDEVSALLHDRTETDRCQPS